MRLLYLYVESHRCLKGMSLNFDAAERFDVEPDTKKQGRVILKYIKGKGLIAKEFWDIFRDGKALGSVESISGIIGKNGMGKTSVASMLYNVCQPVDDPQGRPPHYICIYKSGLSYVCMHGNHWKLDASSLPKDIKKAWQEKVCLQTDIPFDFIYYSPFTSTEQSISSYGKSYIDISTGGLLKRSITERNPVGEAAFSELAFNEYIKILRFVNVCNAKGMRLPKDIPLPLPIAVDVMANKRIRKELNARIDNIKREPHYDIKYVDVSGFLRELLKICESEYFVFRVLGAFLASLVIADWPLIEKFDAKVVKSYECLSKYAKIVTRLQGTEAVLREMSGVIVEDAAERKMQQRLLGSYSELKRTLESDAQLVRICKRLSIHLASIIELLSEMCEYCQMKFGKTKTAWAHHKSDMTFYVKLPEDEKRLSRWADLIVKSNPFMTFLQFSFTKMSSGEMAYLSMLGRLYHVFSRPNFKRTIPYSSQKDVVVFLDEAETTLHPMWQRYLVYVLIWFVTKFAKGKSVHLIFASHSPVLLSDIPKGNVCFLEFDKSKSRTCCLSADEVAISNTFGANIFDLYRVPFFLAQGPMGAFAKHKIDSALKDVAECVRHRVGSDKNNAELPAEAKFTLKLSGDPCLEKYLRGLIEGGLLCDIFRV